MKLKTQHKQQLTYGWTIHWMTVLKKAWAYMHGYNNIYKLNSIWDTTNEILEKTKKQNDYNYKQLRV